MSASENLPLRSGSLSHPSTNIIFASLSVQLIAFSFKRLTATHVLVLLNRDEKMLNLRGTM